MDSIKFGKFIAELRKEKKMTQKELAEKLNLTDKAVSKWERGLSFPDITMLNPLAKNLGVDISELVNCERGNKEKVDVEKAVKEAIEKINKTKEKREKRNIKIKRITIVVSIIVFILSVALQCVYLFLKKRHGYEYIVDSMPCLVNQVILISAFLVLLLGFMRKNKIKNIIVILVFTILSIINIAFAINNGFTRQSIITFSNDFSNQLVLKKDRKTGETYFYRNTKILFAKPSEQFSYAVEGKIKTKWLTTDICSITYEDANGNLREFVATYGDRGDGSYYWVSTTMHGNWQHFTKNGVSTKLISDSKGITIKKEGESHTFENTDIKQFGTIAIVLYDEDIPKYVIALNKDCELDSITDIIEDGGTITLVEVSMEKTIPEVLKCIDYKGNLQDYKIVDMDSYHYKVNNGILYVKYDDEIVEVPGEYSEMLSSFNDDNYIISKEKTVFFYNDDDKKYLVYSDDMGKTWNKTELPKNESIESIQFITKDIGFMLRFNDVAMTLASGNIYKTTDGGKTWTVASSGIRQGDSYSFSTGSRMKFIDKNLGFVTKPSVGTYCELYITKDGGRNFEQVKIPVINEVYDYYELPTFYNGILYVEIGQGNDGDYNGGDTVTYYSKDNGANWFLKEEN